MNRLYSFRSRRRVLALVLFVLWSAACFLAGGSVRDIAFLGWQGGIAVNLANPIHLALVVAMLTASAAIIAQLVGQGFNHWLTDRRMQKEEARRTKEAQDERIRQAQAEAKAFMEEHDLYNIEPGSSTLVEYSLLAALIAILVIGALTVLSGSAADIFNELSKIIRSP